MRDAVASPRVRVVVEPCRELVGLLGEIAWECVEQFVAYGLGRRSESEPMGELGLPDQEKAQSFVGSQTGEVGLESIDQFYASPSTLGGEDWYTSFTQRFYIAQNRPLGDLEHLGEILGRGFATVLQHQQHVQNSGGAHGGQFRNLTVDVWFRASC